MTSTQCSPEITAPSNRARSGPAPIGRPPEVVDRDLEDLVVDREEVDHQLETRVVRVHLREEHVVGAFDVGRALAAQHGARVELRRRRASCGSLRVRCRATSVSELDLDVVAHHVGAVLGDVDELRSPELAAQRRVLATAGRAQRDPAVGERVEQRPELVVDLLLVVEQGAVHVDGDQADVGDVVEQWRLDDHAASRARCSTVAVMARSPVSTSARLTDSSGWWLIPSGLRRNSMPTPVIAPMAMAS